MESLGFGRRLEEARLNKGLSLEDVSFELKINLKTLKKLEASQTNDLPKAPFTKGFIKTYCSFLEIDSQPVIDEYMKTLDEPAKTLSKGVLIEDVDPDKVFAFDVLRNQIVPIAALFLIVLGVAGAYRYLTQEAVSQSAIRQEPAKLQIAELSDEAPGASVSKEQEQNLDEETPATTVQRLEDEEAGSEPQKEDKKLELSRVATVYEGQKVDTKANTQPKVKDIEKAEEVVEPPNKLVVEPLSESYLYIQTNLDDRPVRATLKTDKKRVFKFETAKIRFLDAGAVVLNFNGENLGILGGFGEEKELEFPSMKEL